MLSTVLNLLFFKIIVAVTMVEAEAISNLLMTVLGGSECRSVVCKL